MKYRELVEGHRAEVLPKLEETFGGKVSILDTRCADTFKGRPVIASCSRDSIDPDETPVHTETRVYLFEMIANDGLMKSCIDGKGKWDEIAHDSAEYKRLESEARLRKLERSLPK